MNAIIRRATVEEIVGYRNKALDLYAEAHTMIEREVGTNVNTIILRVWNDGRRFY